jgi:hypothetical protein
MKRVPILTGGCQCGAVRYALYAAPRDVHLCHCRMCQKATGGPFAALAPVRRADFAWTRGQPAAFASSSITLRDYCAACGTPLSFRYRARDFIALTLGSLDDPSAAPPQANYGIESRVAWFTAALHELPEAPTAEGDPPIGLAAMVSFQHPDHDTDAGWKPPRG